MVKQKKKLLIISIIFLIMFFTITCSLFVYYNFFNDKKQPLSPEVAEASYSDASTEPIYNIYTLQDLFQFSKSVNKSVHHYLNETVYLMNDITITYGTWVPIAIQNSSGNFMGTFDGNGHTIWFSGNTTLSGRDSFYENEYEEIYHGAVSSAEVSCIGLFGHITDSTIKNLEIKGNMTYYSNLAPNYIGVVAGLVHDVTLSNVLVSANIKLREDETVSYKNIYIGGLFGAYDNATLIACRYNGSITCEVGTRSTIVEDLFSPYGISSSGKLASYGCIKGSDVAPGSSYYSGNLDMLVAGYANASAARNPANPIWYRTDGGLFYHFYFLDITTWYVECRDHGKVVPSITSFRVESYEISLNGFIKDTSTKTNYDSTYNKVSTLTFKRDGDDVVLDVLAEKGYTYELSTTTNKTIISFKRESQSIIINKPKYGTSNITGIKLFNSSNQEVEQITLTNQAVPSAISFSYTLSSNTFTIKVGNTVVATVVIDVANNDLNKYYVAKVKVEGLDVGTKEYKNTDNFSATSLARDNASLTLTPILNLKEYGSIWT